MLSTDSLLARTLMTDACEAPHSSVGLLFLSPSDLQVFPHPVKPLPHQYFAGSKIWWLFTYSDAV